MQKIVNASGPVNIVLNSVFLLINGVILLGMIMSLQGKMRWLGMTGSILSFIDLGCCCLTLPFGIWYLVAASKPEVKDAFTS
jgi:hypothetical protein